MLDTARFREEQAVKVLEDRLTPDVGRITTFYGEETIIFTGKGGYGNCW
jgi:hypothetical protein